ncbi:hypothetical protein ACFX1X_031327 [Malus domestica]
MTKVPEHLNMEWVGSAKQVFVYFTERAPRSHFKQRGTSLVWNYKYADVDFRRLQARDMLQHLWTGRISNASVDVVEGSRSVDVQAVGPTKSAAIDRILGDIDEDVYTFFEPDLPSEHMGLLRTKIPDGLKPNERRSSLKALAFKSGSTSSHSKAQRPLPTPEKKNANHITTNPYSRDDSAWLIRIGWHCLLGHMITIGGPT